MMRYLGLAIPCLLVPALAAAELRLTVDAGDSPLVINGWLGEGADFTGNLRLTAEGDPQGDTADNAQLGFRLLASDLKSEHGPSIGRQQVTLKGDPLLQAGVPKDFQITVTGVTEPAVYRGKLEVLPAGRPRAASLSIDLELIARARPALQPLRSAEKLSLSLVNCRGFGCRLAGLLLPESALLDHWTLQFDNPTAAPVKLAGSALEVLGEQTGYPLTPAHLALAAEPQTLPARAIGGLTLKLDRSAMPPDHYTGALYLSAEGAKDRLTVPVDLHVRAGPFWPLLAILAGILLGRLFKYMQERGRPQAEQLTAVNRMELVLLRADPDDSQRLEAQLAELRQQVYRGELDGIPEQLKAIGSRLAVLAELRQIEERLKGKEQHPKAREALAEIQQARERLAAKQSVDDLLPQVRQALEDLQQSGLMTAGAPGTEFDQAVRATARAVTAAGRAGAVESGRARRAWLRPIKNALITLAGLSDELRAEATLWIVRPLLYFVLLLGLLAVGLNTLYVSQGLAFGATPFADYLGLLLWGLSADVVGRSLSNLPGVPGFNKPSAGDG